MKSKIAFLSVSFSLAALAEPVEVDNDIMTADFDFRTGPLKVISEKSDILNLAWNDTADWAPGGGSGTARLTVTPMMSETADDVSTWKAGTALALVETAGEDAEVWVPQSRGLYRVQLTNAAGTETCFYDCSETVDLGTGTPVDDFAIRALSASAELAEGGADIHVEVKDANDKVLVEGRDYIILYAGNRTVGKATAKAYGVGAYAGMVSVPFDVLPSVAASAELDDVFLDTRDGNLVVDMRKLVGKIAWNTSEKFPTDGTYSVWAVGGDPDQAKVAKVSVAELSGPNAEEPASYVELFSNPGEGTAAWKPTAGVWYQLKMELVSGGQASEQSLTRRLMFSPKGMRLLFR